MVANGGQFPSVRDIDRHYKKNGDIPLWKIIWRKIVRLAKQLLKLDDTPNTLRQAIFEILKTEDK